MAKTKKATPDFPFASTYTYNGETKEFHYKTSLSLTDKGVFILSVVDNIISDEHGYTPHLQGLLFDEATIRFYTDIELPDPIEEMEKFFKETLVVDNLDIEDIDELEIYIDELIQHRLRIYESKQTPYNELITSLNNFINKYDKKLAKTLTPKNVDKLVAGLNKLGTNLNTVPVDFTKNS